MGLPSSGSISMDNINVELGFASGSQISLEQTSVRGLLGRTIAGSTISLNDGYGKTSIPPLKQVSLPVGTNYLNMNLRTFAVNNGWDQTVACEITIPAGTYIWSDSVSLPALTIDGNWPKGVTLINNGYIMGKGGNGGYYGGGGAGGPAISLGTSCTITNNSYIGGGGGGGGSAQSGSVEGPGGGGAGGGNGANGTYGGRVGYGGSGGAPGSAGTTGTADVGVGSAGGGRIMPGVSGTNQAGGTGGVSGSGFSDIAGGCPKPPYVFMDNWYGGGGGGWGAAGGTGSYFGFCIGIGTQGRYAGGGGGGDPGYNANGTGSNGYGGGAGGKCINLNGYSITWNATGTRYGGIS